MNEELATGTLKQMQATGFDRAACRVATDELHELQAETGEINLFRTNFETDIGLVGIAGNRRASSSLNKTDPESIADSIDALKQMADGASPDPAYDIAPAQPHESFESGPAEPDYDRMYDRINEVQAFVKAELPTLNIRAASVTYVRRQSCHTNSNDVLFHTSRGLYRVGLQFSSREGERTSSMMYTGYSAFDLDTAIVDAINVEMLLRQSVEQVAPKKIPGKFVGDLLIAPNCVGSFISFLTERLSDGAMIAGTSVYRDKLGEQIAAKGFTLSATPCSPEFAGGYSVTGDGFRAADSVLVDDGVLKSFQLGLYGANKTGLPRSPNSGGCYQIAPGSDTLDEMIAGVDEGILINRFSGGYPNDRGDFSGIAKNSYYIRDGKIQFPIVETTVSGNMLDILSRIDSISAERLNFGDRLIPWIRTKGVTAS